MTPACPPHYDCTFTPRNPPHYYAHWWDGDAGIAVAVLAVIALVIVLTMFIYWIAQVRQERIARKRAEDSQIREHQAQREERATKLAIEEQRTMQIDSAKGNPEMLKIIREMQREQERDR